MSPSGF